MSEMVERVAKEILRVSTEEVLDPTTWDEITIDAKTYMLDIARAAIIAMRDPTAKMADAAYRLDGTGMALAISYERAYTAMIDEALK